MQRRSTARWLLAGAVLAVGCDGELLSADGGAPRDAPGLDAPGLDAPGLDAFAPDVGRDAPSEDTRLDVPVPDGSMLPGLSCFGPPPSTIDPVRCDEVTPVGCTPRSPTPLGYWRFEAAAPTADETGAHALRIPSGAAGAASFGASGAAGGHLAMRTSDPDNDAQVYVPYTSPLPATMTLELAVRFTARTLDYDDIRVVRMLGGAELGLSREGWGFGGVTFPLSGDDVEGWAHYTDGRWHHLAIVADGTNLSLAVDGRHPAAWTQPGTISSASGPGIYFGYHSEPASQGLDMDLDEVALYDGALPSSVLAQHARDVLAGRAYGADACAIDWCTPASHDVSLDARDYAPGWVEGDWRAIGTSPIEQIGRYPLPRFAPGHGLPRIPSIWMDPDYLAGQFEQVPGTYATRFDAAAVAANATALQIELAERWHQGLSRHSRIDAAWTAYANAHPEVQLGGASFWGGRVSSLSGAERVAGAASPALDPAIFAPDGTRSRDTLESWATTAGLTRGFDVITENGETPVDHMHGLREADLASNAAANADWIAHRAEFGGDVRAYLSSREASYVRAYRDALLTPTASSHLSGAMFTYYNDDGHPQYSPVWASIRGSLGVADDGHPRALTSFYPRRAAWWFTGSSAWHGWLWIQQSRPAEIAAGDAHFWPLVAAGWAFHEERNMRPAQWLAILKSLSVAGADATMPAYFVIPGCGGGFGGATDCDCTGAPASCMTNVVQNRGGYAWQAVAPSYAQGIASRYASILSDPASVWRMDVRSPDPGSLAVVRQLGGRYVIAVSTHTLENTLAGRRDAERVLDVRLDLDGTPATLETLRVPARAQGSVYLLDTTSSPPTLVWLDAWHEPSHFAHWSRDVALEAEVDDGRTATSGVRLVTRTEQASGAAAWDYGAFTTYLATDATTYTELAAGAAPHARYIFTPREDTTYAIWVRARTRGHAGTVRVALDDGAAQSLGCVRETDWAWVRLACPDATAASSGVLGAGEHTLTIEPSSTDIEIDAARLVASEACYADAVDCVGCAG